MDSEQKSKSDYQEFLWNWSEPFIKGLMFGIGHFIAYKIVGKKLREIFKPAIKASN